MFIDDFGRVVSLSGSCPKIIGRHWVYCGFLRGEVFGVGGKLYSFDGMNWYKFNRDEAVKIEQSKINAFPCSVWEMLYTKELLDDVEFVKRHYRFIDITEFIDSISNKNNILEGLLS